MEKLNDYQGFTGRVHSVRDKLREKLETWRSEHPEGLRGVISRDPGNSAPPKLERTLLDYPHVYRKKTRKELIRVSTAVMGIEFSYAAETAFVSPTLLKIGVEHKRMTMVWGLSPLIGFFLTPLLGSLSDGCTLKWGRRRPFILLLSLGVFLGLLLVPNGKDIGRALGDYYPSMDENRTSLVNISNSEFSSPNDSDYPHPWGIFFTILGTVLLDFNADSCQSPARAYLLDVCLPVDHARGLSTFTVMAGLGGFFGYALGGTNWDETSIGEMLGGHVRAVFTLITFLFVICVFYTVTSFKEIPLYLLQRDRQLHEKLTEEAIGELEPTNAADPEKAVQSYGATASSIENEEKTVESLKPPSSPDLTVPTVEEIPSLKEYLLSIVYMPGSMRLLCLTNLFCWMAHVCYSLYFTDFVGEAVFNGDPQAQDGTKGRDLYEEGVRFGCWGMSMYSLSCSCYSLVIEYLIRKFGARKMYVGGLLFYSLGMALMALTKSPVGVIVFSWAAGVMYSTLFTMPYLLVARYHATGIFAVDAQGGGTGEMRCRGLGTDVAIVSSMVFLAQFILSMCMGSIISWSGTTTAVVSVASVLAFCGAISAWFVVYIDL